MSRVRLGIYQEGGELFYALTTVGRRGVVRLEETGTISLKNREEIGEKVGSREYEIALSLPVSSLSVHNLTFPFGERRKIRQAVAYELEARLPHPLGQYVYKYEVVKREAKSSSLFCLLAPNSLLEESLSLLGEKAEKVSLLMPGSIALALLLGESFPEEDVLLIDRENRYAVGVFLRRGNIAYLKRFYTVIDDGELKKEGKIKELCREITGSIEILKWQGLVEGSLRVFINARESSLDFWREELVNPLFSSIEPIEIAELYALTLSPGTEIGEAPLKKALALNLVGYERKVAFNFLTFPQKSEAMGEGVKKALKWGGVLAFLSLFALSLDSYLGYYYKKLRLQALKKEIESTVRIAAPEVTKLVDPLTQLKNKIAEVKKMAQGISYGVVKVSVTEILKDISQAAPKDAPILINSFHLEGTYLLIKGTAPNYEALDTFRKALVKIPYFRTVDLGSTSLAKEVQAVNFEIKITVLR